MLTNNAKNVQVQVQVEAQVQAQAQAQAQKRCCCYSSQSTDSRCCGACYHCCPKPEIDDRCEACPNNFCTYWQSGYIQTTQGIKREEERCEEFYCDDCCCTTACFPLKFSVFFPCCFGR